MTLRRIRHGEKPSGEVMQPKNVSLVIGRREDGVPALLDSFARRADMRDSLVVNGLAESWDDEAIANWLQRLRPGAAHIVLASADLATPRHLLQTLADHPDLASAYRLNAVTGTASSLTLSEAAERVCAGSDGTTEREEARGSESLADPQLRRLFACVDRIVLTHTDRVRPEVVTRLAKALKALNPPAPILRAKNGDIGPARLVDGGLFDPITGSVDIDRWLCEAAFNFEATRRGGSAAVLNLPETAFSCLNNDIGIRFFAVTIDQPLDSTVLSVFLKLLMADRGADLLRLKGIVATTDYPDRPALIDGREHLIQPLLWLDAWPTADHRGRLVFTTTRMSEDWIRTLLATLTEQLDLAETPVFKLAMAVKTG